MSDLVNGTLVQHVSLGVGKVVALEPFAVHVFFPGADTRFAAKLRLPAARALLRTDGITPDPWLEGLSAFALDPESRRWALASTWLTQEQAVAEFVAAHPRAFEAGAPGAAAGRAARWRAAAQAFGRAFGEGEGRRLLDADDLRELSRRALAVVREAAPLLPEDDAEALVEAFADPDATRLFFERLLELVALPSPSRARFDRLFAAATALSPLPEAAWVLATLLPFLAQPARQALLHPRTACAAARRLGCDLRWDDTPNWATYAALRGFSLKLLADLGPLGARDLADVEAFLHATAGARSRPKPRRAAAPRPSAPRAVATAAPSKPAGQRGRRATPTPQRRSR